MNMVNILDARCCLDIGDDCMEIEILGCAFEENVERGTNDAPRCVEEHQTKCHAKQGINSHESREPDNERTHDDEQTPDKCLQDVPECTLKIQVSFLTLVEESDCDEFCHKSSQRYEEHRTCRKVNRILEAHCTHPENEDGHSYKEETIKEGPYDLGSDEAVGLKLICFLLGEVPCDKCDENAPGSREGMECIGDHRDGTCPETNPEFNHKVDSCQPPRNRECTSVGSLREVAGAGGASGPRSFCHVFPPSVDLYRICPLPKA